MKVSPMGATIGFSSYIEVRRRGRCEHKRYRNPCLWHDFMGLHLACNEVDKLVDLNRLCRLPARVV